MARDALKKQKIWNKVQSTSQQSTVTFTDFCVKGTHICETISRPFWNWMCLRLLFSLESIVLSPQKISSELIWINFAQSWIDWGPWSKKASSVLITCFNLQKLFRHVELFLVINDNQDMSEIKVKLEAIFFCIVFMLHLLGCFATICINSTCGL